MDDCQDIVLTYSVKEIFYTLQGRVLAAGALPFSAVFPVAIYGQVARPTVPVPSAVSAIRTLSALTG